MGMGSTAGSSFGNSTLASEQWKKFDYHFNDDENNEVHATGGLGKATGGGHLDGDGEDDEEGGGEAGQGVAAGGGGGAKKQARDRNDFVRQSQYQNALSGLERKDVRHALD